ncbi:sugar lactone lactonase YvrE [Rhizobium mesoamericanum]|uniref:L-dopachrome tautomerase-related protein n=1 Tax=Rhizobium mesoamericanum TaxID=1079800 RepID=UPI002781B2C1|nr:L-dopachrome tautomerase-related protein [Rhizobium mesoamericanum]MDQ0564080.1 sugar lactone lactonase YvrE [Rhizobium mesoamericanum]
MIKKTLLLLATTGLMLALPVAQSFAEDKAPKLETVATFNEAMPTGVTVAGDGRIFINYPRWGDDVPFTVAELINGRAVAYPDAEINKADPENPAKSLISVQSVVVDPANRLWILDTAAPGFKPPIQGGAKLVAVDLATNKVVKTIVFPADVILNTTYVNDIRFDLTKGPEGVAYVTDSSLTGPGGIIVVDLASGKAFRRLTGDPSTSADKDFVAVIDGQKFMNRPKDGKPSKIQIASDGIAISPDGETLYYSAVSGRHLYAVPTAALLDQNVSEKQLAAKVKDFGLKGASDGLETDDKGRIYGGDYEHDSIRVLDKGKWSTLIHSHEIEWPDTLSIAADGYLYFTANQLDKQAGFHEGIDMRKKPYKLLRIKIDGGPVLLNK